MDNIIEISKKKADKSLNRVLIPKWFTEKYGREFKMVVYENKIELIPIKTKENQEL